MQLVKTQLLFVLTGLLFQMQGCEDAATTAAPGSNTTAAPGSTTDDDTTTGGADCSGITCEAATHVDSAAKATAKCAADPCEVNEAVCCDARMACDATGCSDSSTRFAITTNKCATDTCGPEDDVACGCADRKPCSAYNTDADTADACDTTTMFLDSDSAVVCVGATCAAVDKDTCCKARGECSTITCPTDTHVSNGETYCALASCDADDAGCCSPRQSCSAYNTDVTVTADRCDLTTHSLLGSAFCDGAACVAGDFGTCCTAN